MLRLVMANDLVAGNVESTSIASLDSRVREVTAGLLEYCRRHDWAGHDPYDALNSPIARLSVLDHRVPRLLLTQLLKRSAWNIRPLLRTPRTRNPKALALFLAAILRLPVQGPEQRSLIGALTDLLAALRAEGSSHSCWGYSFPWQTRTHLVPSLAPNLVCTVFVADALLDAYEHTGNQQQLSMAISAADYILEELYWVDGRTAAFSYPLSSIRVPIHNANLLAAALLARVAGVSGRERYLEAAVRAADYSAGCQAADGSWPYGAGVTQQWIDNFHTGYNLCALWQLSKRLGGDRYGEQLRKGFEFYRAHFFREDAAARYYHDRTYPIDIHAVAQSIITLMTLRDLDARNVALAYRVFAWAVRHMLDAKGFFYYRVLRFGTIRTSYMRWSQAWMLRALAELPSVTSQSALEPVDQL